MSFINSIFSSSKKSSPLKINFIKGDNIWHVTNAGSIMYIGDEDSCKLYMNHMESAA